MKTVRDYEFITPTVCICEPNRYERLYDGPVDKIPHVLHHYKIYRVIINKVINNTYMEVIA